MAKYDPMKERQMTKSRELLGYPSNERMQLARNCIHCNFGQHVERHYHPATGEKPWIVCEKTGNDHSYKAAALLTCPEWQEEGGA